MYFRIVSVILMVFLFNFPIASVTKSLTATAILKLNSERLLDINKPVQTYIPWFQFQNQENYNQVTVKDLLIHSADGIGFFETDVLGVTVMAAMIHSASSLNMSHK